MIFLNIPLTSIDSQINTSKGSRHEAGHDSDIRECIKTPHNLEPDDRIKELLIF